MPEVSEPFSLPPLIEEKLRRLTLVLTPVGILTLLLSIWQNTQIKNATQVAHYGLPLLSVIFSIVWVLTLKNRISGRQATLAFTIPACLHIYLEQLEHSVTGLLYQYGDPGNFGWMFVKFLLLFLSLNSHRARWVSFAFLATHVAIYVSGLRKFHPTPEIELSFTQYFIASMIAICILGLNSDIRQHLGKVQTLADTDALTQLINRRQMQLCLERSVQSPHPFVLLLLDIDHFKLVNDQYGHNRGDAVLKELSHHLSTCLRSGDLLGRWGGEEFLLLLPNTSDVEAQKLALRLVSAVRERRFANNLPITLSIGGASYLPGERPEDVVHRADTALYQAKHAGRDCFCFHTIPNEAKQAA